MTPRGSALRYTGLSESDAGGRELRVWLELGGRELLLRVDDLQAGTRFRIDPFIQQAKVTASNWQANDGLTAIGGHSGQGLSTCSLTVPPETARAGPPLEAPSESFACPLEDRCHGAASTAASNEQHSSSREPREGGSQAVSLL
jgi:hypothetical protein